MVRQRTNSGLTVASADRVERLERARARGRAIGSVIIVGYFVGLFALLVGESGSPTTMLTAGDGLTYRACMATGWITFLGLALLSIVPLLRRGDQVRNKGAAFKAIAIVSAFLGATAGVAAYPFAAAFENHHLFSGSDVRRETRQFLITDAYVFHRAEHEVSIPSDDRRLATLFGTFHDASFEVSPEDWAILRQRNHKRRDFNPNHGTDDKLCLALPVEVNGTQVRALADGGTPLPEGSVVPCT